MKDWNKTAEEPYKAGYRKMLKKTFMMPDGVERVYDIKDEGQHACVLALTENNEVLIAKQYRPGPEKVLMELPGGIVDDGEDPTDAVARELLEETGYAGDIVSLGVSSHCAYSNVIKNHFVATNVKCVSDQKLETGECAEFVDVELVPLEEFKEILEKGDLTDAITAYRALNHLKLL